MLPPTASTPPPRTRGLEDRESHTALGHLSCDPDVPISSERPVVNVVLCVGSVLRRARIRRSVLPLPSAKCGFRLERCCLLVRDPRVWTAAVRPSWRDSHTLWVRADRDVGGVLGSGLDLDRRVRPSEITPRECSKMGQISPIDPMGTPMAICLTIPGISSVSRLETPAGRDSAHLHSLAAGRREPELRAGLPLSRVRSTQCLLRRRSGDPWVGGPRFLARIRASVHYEDGSSLRLVPSRPLRWILGVLFGRCRPRRQKLFDSGETLSDVGQ
jgi:hypothetical protein